MAASVSYMPVSTSTALSSKPSANPPAFASFPKKALEQRYLSYLAVLQPLILIDLVNSGGLARIGADSRLFSGFHAIAQRWSAALRAHPTKPSGILYPARHDAARRACCLFDLPAAAFAVNTAGSLIDSPHHILLGRILNTYDFGLIS